MMMDVWAQRVLVVLCSLLLVAPQGWCCFAPPAAPAADEAAQEAPAHTCCSQKMAPAKAPCKEENPRQPFKCCCADEAQVPAGPEKLAFDLAPAPAALIGAEPEAPTCPEFAAPAPLCRPLQLLKCVWLC